ncbi:MAG: hypothetical protein Hyperionvirus3_166 [Hyperionvirus sp.]|uniref:Methyltransferase n=1 Tax=Hyperionvirus sp. TaxID=2487770 RepID=A0A3G5A6Y4_9VIRU|nr:MAG: hypothetical protein Hyperionvirus3_166 [Hyperionvirus sp.]
MSVMHALCEKIEKIFNCIIKFNDGIIIMRKFITGSKNKHARLVKNKSVFKKYVDVYFRRKKLCYMYTKMAYNEHMRNKIKSYIEEKGLQFNRRCNWTNQEIFSDIAKLKLYNTSNLEIQHIKLYVVDNDSEDGGFSSDIGHVIPTPKVIDELVTIIHGKKTVSIGCGVALFEYLLQNRGCAVKCVDINIPDFSYTTVCYPEKKDSDADVLLLIWPEPDFDHEQSKYSKSGYDERALLNFTGHTVIFIGREKDKKNHIGSLNFKNILKTKFSLDHKIKLPFCKDGKEYYQPYAYVYNIRLNLGNIDIHTERIRISLHEFTASPQN